MPEKKEKSPAVIYVRPSAAQIVLLRQDYGKDFREKMAEVLLDYLGGLIGGDLFVRIDRDWLSGLDSLELDAVRIQAVGAAVKHATGIREEKRLEALTSYTAEELRAALERQAADKGRRAVEAANPLGEPGEAYIVPGSDPPDDEDYDEPDEANEPPPVPPKKSHWDAAKERA